MTEPREIGVGLISVGWMGKLHTRAYQALPIVYPELRLRPHLVHDDPLDLVGALIDLGDLSVAHHPLDREILGVPVAA